MLDEDYGDITDPTSGRDIKVVCSKQPGKKWAMTEVRPRGKQSTLSENDSQSQSWLSSIPNLDEIYQTKSYDELAKIINDWLNDDDEDDDVSAQPSAPTTSENTNTSSSGYRSLDDAFADLVGE